MFLCSTLLHETSTIECSEVRGWRKEQIMKREVALAVLVSLFLVLPIFVLVAPVHKGAELGLLGFGNPAVGNLSSASASALAPGGVSLWRIMPIRRFWVKLLRWFLGKLFLSQLSLRPLQLKRRRWLLCSLSRLLKSKYLPQCPLLCPWSSRLPVQTSCLLWRLI